MFVRKGTTLRKKHQSVRRPRRPSLQNQQTQADPEAGTESQGNSTRSQKSGAGTSTGSSTSSTLTLNEEKNLVGGASYASPDRCRQIDYGSILFQFREAQDESANLFDFLQRMREVIWQSLVLTVFLLLMFGLPISMIAMGTSYLADCPKEPKLPIYLLVGGAFGFIHICIVLWQQKRSRDYMLLDDTRDDDDNDEDDVMTRSYRFTGHILSIFLLLWFCLGNYWLFSIWLPNFEQPLHEPRNWCSKNVYYYAFYQILACYSLLGLVALMLVGLLLVYFYAIRHRK